VGYASGMFLASAGSVALLTGVIGAVAVVVGVGLTQTFTIKGDKRRVQEARLTETRALEREIAVRFLATAHRLVTGSNKSGPLDLHRIYIELRLVASPPVVTAGPQLWAGMIGLVTALGDTSERDYRRRDGELRHSNGTVRRKCARVARARKGHGMASTPYS
jgi:hypothetical protein